MPEPSNFDLRLLELLPNSIDSFIRFAFICIGALIIYKIYIKRRWN